MRAGLIAAIILNLCVWRAGATSCSKACRLSCQGLADFDEIHRCEIKTCGCELNIFKEARNVLESMFSGDGGATCRAFGGKCIRPKGFLEFIKYHFGESLFCWNYDFTQGELLPDLCSGDTTCCVSDHGIDFLLYTREDPNGKEFQPTNTSVLASKFSAERPTKVIVHGFSEHGFAEWVKNMTRDFLDAYDCNVIIVDWAELSGDSTVVLSYPVVVSRIRYIGYYTADVLQLIAETTGAQFGDFHIVGFSLGAHIAAHVGHQIIEKSWGKLGRITGLDAAGPLFNLEIPGLEHLSPDLDEAFEELYDKERLNEADATFVDAIHTAVHSNGRKDPFAHVDFYPNGGIEDLQPGCDDYPNDVACPHVAAITFFLESIADPQRYVARQCEDWDDFLAGECDENPTNWMGEGAKEDPSGVFYLKRSEY